MSRKGENIRKRKDGRWEGRFCKGRKDNGRIIYGSVYASTYRDVKEKLKNAMLKLPNCEISQQSKPSEIVFGELIKLWQETNKIRLKRGTQTKYDNIISKHILPEFGNLPVSKIDSAIINMFLSNKLQSGRIDGYGGLSPSYVRSMALVLSSVISYGVSENLCSPPKSPICKPNPVPKELIVLNINDQRKLENFLIQEKTSTSIGILLSLYTGMRIGEVCALSWDDVDLDDNIIYIRHTVSRVKSVLPERKTELILDEPKTRSSKRVIPIPLYLTDILKRYRESSHSIFVISNDDGFSNPRTFDLKFHSILKECGIDSINYHALRHTFATRCVEAGVDIKSLSEILGHANVSITLNTYVHSSMELKRKQIEKLSALNCVN